VTYLDQLLSTLEDPFEMFPVQSVERSLVNLVAESEEAIAEQSGWWGVSRKYYSVEQEHHLEMISLLIGSAFVLGQTAITQTVAIAVKLHSLAGKPAWLPGRRDDIMRTAATFHIGTKLSDMVLINAVANYFKHHREWPDDWSPTGSKAADQTIEIVRSLGFSPGNYDENLWTALRCLNVSVAASGAMLGNRIQDWRERLAENLRSALLDHGFECCSPPDS
jgi:hypothetical protein